MRPGSFRACSRPDLIASVTPRRVIPRSAAASCAVIGSELVIGKVLDLKHDMSQLCNLCVVTRRVAVFAPMS